MNNLTITIEAPELAAAIKSLAKALTAAPNVAAIKATEKSSAVSEAVPIKEEPKPVPAAETHYTVEQVRESLGKLSQAKGKAVAKGILTQIGVKSVSDLQPDQFALAMQLIEEAA